MEKKLNKHLKHLDKQEKKMLSKKDNQLLSHTVNPVLDRVKGKIPDKLICSLEAAFYKAFQLVFEKGYSYIEKTYNKDKKQLEFDLNNLAVDQEFSKKHIKQLDRQAKGAKTLNSFISVVEGSVLGLLGIGLPDIPLLIAIIIKTISEVALSYGYDCETEEEKAYILLLICGAIAKKEEKCEFNFRVDRLGENIDKNEELHFDLEGLMKEAAGVLSDTLLTAKFIQGIPVVGVVGGIVNYSIIKKVGKYSSLKYKKRYLLSKTGK